jgi:hypothetical protein
MYANGHQDNIDNHTYDVTYPDAKDDYKTPIRYIKDHDIPKDKLW